MSTIRIHNIILLLLLFAIPSVALGQFSFIAKSNKYTVGKNETIKVTFTWDSGGDDFSPPIFENFKIVAGPMQGSNYSNINGKVSNTISWTYHLRALNIGTFNIEKASVVYNGKTFYTKPMSIEVKKEIAKPKNPNSPEAKADDGTILEIELSRRKAYVGQPIYVRYKLYSRFRHNVGLPEEPNFNGFLVNDNSKKTESKIEVKNGREYYSEIIKEFALFPQKPGSYDFDDLNIEMVSEIPSRDSWGFPTGRNVRHYAQSKFPNIEVMALAKNPPAGFKGAVGDYTLDVNLSRNEVNADESVSLNISIKGKGNHKFVSLPEIQLPSSLEAYDPKYTENLSLQNNGFSGYKKKETLIIPRSKGTYKIPPVRFVYFDLSSESYKVLTSENLELKVLTGPEIKSNDGSNTPSVNRQQNIEVLSSDIAFIKTNDIELKKESKPLIGTTLYWTFLGIGLMGISLPWLLVPLSTRVISEKRKSGSGKIYKRINKQLNKAVISAKEGNKEGTYAILESSLNELISEWLNIPVGELNFEKIEKQLSKLNKTELLEPMKYLFKKCSMARYSPLNISEMKEDVEKAKNLLRKIQKEN